MSLVPAYLRAVLDDLTPATIWDQDFGLGLYDDDLYRPTRGHSLRYQPFYLRPWRHMSGAESGVSNVTDNANEFKVNLDVQQFKPEEIKVKIVDKHVIIEGKHEERQDDHGYISRQFQRRYLLPENVKKDALQSQLSSDGVLTILAPKVKPLVGKEQAIPVVQTNRPAIKSDGKKKEAGEKMES